MGFVPNDVRKRSPTTDGCLQPSQIHEIPSRIFENSRSPNMNILLICYEHIHMLGTALNKISFANKVVGVIVQLFKHHITSFQQVYNSDIVIRSKYVQEFQK